MSGIARKFTASAPRCAAPADAVCLAIVAKKVAGGLPQSNRAAHPHKVVMNQRFRWNERLHRQREFSQVIREGRRYSSAGLILWVYRAAASDQRPRLGLAISGSVGKAVTRNRLKRLLREIFRLHKAELPPGVDLVFGARPLKEPLRYQTLEPVVMDLWKKAGIWPSAVSSH